MTDNRKLPRSEQECFFTPPKALFPREVLEPLYRQYVEDHPPHDRTDKEISGFYSFLLEQVAPEK